MNNAVNLQSMHIRKTKKNIFAVKGAGTPDRHVPSQKSTGCSDLICHLSESNGTCAVVLCSLLP